MTDRHETDGSPETDAAQRGGAPPRRTRAEERSESIKTPSRTELMDRIEGLERDLAEARERADENLRSWQRAAADFSNFRRRTEEERGTVSQFATAILIGKLLSVLDDFDRALENVPHDAHESWVDGVRLVERKLRNVLDSEGVTAIEALGKQFDPNVHEAVVHEETTEHADNEVISELQRGYRLHDRILRPALVKVANNPKHH